jgi:hypothetical protein
LDEAEISDQKIVQQEEEKKEVYIQSHSIKSLNGKKIIFAVLAHNNVHVLSQQLNNIRRFNPNAGIVLYNGGTNKNFGKSLNIPICPYSRPLKWGSLAPFLWGVMKWLEKNKINYKYLVNLDNDVLFLKHGYERFLDKTMHNYDCMGWYMTKSGNPKHNSSNFVIKSMWRKWNVWGPFFRTGYIMRCFNPGQVYRRSIVKRMLAKVNHAKVRSLFKRAPVFALEETFFATLAKKCGGRCRAYPRSKKIKIPKFAVRGNSLITLQETKLALRQPNYYWIHPVKGSRLIRFNQWLLNGKKITVRKRIKKKKIS